VNASHGPPAVASSPAKRLAGLDGVRGLAALFVVVNHVFLRAFPGYPVDRAPFWAGWFIYGRFAVVVFIVLSGFSLALSPARHGWRLGAVSRFARRRAGRILPAYWAALVFSLAGAWLIVPQPGNGVPDGKSVLVNGLLVQNLVSAHSPNGAFWSMAVEAQLYVAFPLLLLMVRRWGPWLMVATVTLLVATVGVIGPHVSRLDTFVVQSPPDLAALFAVGVLTAGIVGASAARKAWPWPWLSLAAAAPVLIRLLDARPLRSLGSSSFSLYLTHGPIVVFVYVEIVAGRVRQGVPAFLATLALALPLTIVFARVFASVFETPFWHRRGSSLSIRRRPAAGVPG
jgi:peptidoglycan/LPS O-acetylase OafA/YrhL